MKRILISAIALFMICSLQSSAQVAKFGVTGGMNFSTSKFSELSSGTRAGWNAGVTCLVDLPLGFTLQPSLVYSQKNAGVAENAALKMGFVELPVSFQWGPDLLVFRPFIDVTPFIGYTLTNKGQAVKDLGDAFDSLWGNGDWDIKDRLGYGLGIGGGFNVWKLQILARYCWNFGSFNDTWDDVKGHLSKDDMTAESKYFGGVTLNVAFFF